jgi:hypothetical protein
MSFAEKYKPTSQKALFHKDIVSSIRKWIINLEARVENKQSCRQTLLVHGPTGCSKTSMIDILFKGFNTLTVDSNDIRNTDKMHDVISGIVGISDVTLANLGKHTAKNKPNIVLVDNIELCDKSIVSFVEAVHSGINIPIIVISNEKKYIEMFKSTSGKEFVAIEVNKPSLLELSKLVMDISAKENLMLTKDDAKSLIEHSMYDCRQLLFLLDQWNISKNFAGSDIPSFLASVSCKHVDLDLQEKLQYITTTEYDTPSFLNLCMSEPSLISNNLYQNYPSLIDDDKALANIADAFSTSQLIQNKIYDQQLWQLYDSYTVSSCLQVCHCLQSTTTMTPKTPKTPSVFAGYKDISLNYANSFEEVKKIASIRQWDTHTLFSVASMIVHICKKFENVIKTLKKGKNTSKKEKFEIHDQIMNNEQHKEMLMQMIDIIYEYRLHEVQQDHIDRHIEEYKTKLEFRQTSIDKVDLRVLKRFINIFSLNTTTKVVSSNIDVCIKMALLDKYIEEALAKPSFVYDKIENLTIELDDLWNLK